MAIKVQAVERGLDIAEFLSRDGRPKTLTEIAAGIGLRVTTTHNLLRTLKIRGYVDQEPGGVRYRLAFMCFRLGQAYAHSRDLIEIARPHLEQLVERTGESGVISVLEHLRLYFVLQVESSQSVAVSFRRESVPNPYHAATGKMLLAHLSEKDIENYLQLYGPPKGKDGLPMTSESFREEMASIREKGYAFRYETAGAEVRAVGAPIRNAEGHVVASIGVSAPASRLQDPQRRIIVEQTVQAAATVSWEMGYRPSETEGGAPSAPGARPA